MAVASRPACREPVIVALAAVLAGCAPASAPSPFSASGEVIALGGADAGPDAACFTCHGLDGSGDGVSTPRLAAMPAGYLVKQLQDYADGRRSHAPMSAIASALRPHDRRAVAFYYASLPPRAAPRGAAAGTAIRRLYHTGDAARGLAACAACHGTHGDGVGLANPPLAGQPAPYLADQLHRWRRSERRNDPRDIMLTISRRLTAAEAAGLAEYAARLSGPRAPDGPGPAPSP